MKTPEGELVEVISVRKPIQKKHGNVLEISRLATKINTIVSGGASRLLSRVFEYASLNGYEGILTYSDNRFGDGLVYEKSGFTFIGETGINYFYTNGFIRYDRFKYRAQPGKTEKQVAIENNVHIVWGAAHKIWLKKF